MSLRHPCVLSVSDTAPTEIYPLSLHDALPIYVRTIALGCRCDPRYASAAGVQAQRAALLVEIETDNGIVGIGEAGIGGGVTPTRIQRGLKPLLVGQDPLLVEHPWPKKFPRTRALGPRGGF